MSISSKLDQVHKRLKSNKWLQYFAIFNRVALAAGFIPSGFVKIMGERFTTLSVNHPMGNYLEALHHTGYYYTTIGVLQVTAAILLLIPGTALLGAILYFPIILNICILSFAVRFDGSLLTAPLMVLSNLFLLCWYYDRLKYSLPIKHETLPVDYSKVRGLDAKFPFGFFGGVLATVIILEYTIVNLYEIRPYNTIGDCQTKCLDSNNPEACAQFCDCIHNQGYTLTKCLDDFEKVAKSTHVKQP